MGDYKVRRRFDDILRQFRDIRNYESQRNETISQFIAFWNVTYGIISRVQIHLEDTIIINRLWKGIVSLIMEKKPEEQTTSYLGLSENTLKEIHEASMLVSSCSVCQNCIVGRLEDIIRKFDTGETKDRHRFIGQILYIILLSMEAQRTFATHLGVDSNTGEEAIVVTFITWDGTHKLTNTSLLASPKKNACYIPIKNRDTYDLLNKAWTQLGYERWLAYYDTLRD